MECEGSCEAHTDNVRRVHIWNGAFDWGEMWYCEEAIAEDTRRGLSVELVRSA